MMKKYEMHKTLHISSIFKELMHNFLISDSVVYIDLFEN